MDKYNILIAEDDADIRAVLKLYLDPNVFSIFEASDGETAYQIFAEQEIHLGIFDVMMPKLNGFNLVVKIRESSNLPIIILTAKQDIDDKIHGLAIGSDDYITKPFNPIEVIARINSILRRTYEFTLQPGLPKIIEVQDLKLDTEKFCLIKNDQQIMLTPSEYKILVLFMQNPNKIFTKMQIYEVINNGYIDCDDNTIMVHISRIREKIEVNPRTPQYIKTVRGLGYKLDA